MPVMYEVEGRPGGSLNVFVAIPTGSSAIEAPCVVSMLRADRALWDAGISATVCVEAGNCHVDDARNSLVRQFLKSKCDRLFFLDADVGFPAENLVSILRHDRDIVAGIYPKKQDDEDFPVILMPEKRERDADGLLEVLRVPTGFMSVARHVIARQVELHRDRAFLGQAATASDRPYYPIFERTISDGRRWSGDYAFCGKVLAAGGRIYIDPDLWFSHQGVKNWEGSLATYWRRSSGVESPVLGEAIEALKRREATHEVFTKLALGWSNGSFSMLPDALMAVWALVKHNDGPVLETGSGLSTIVAALARRDRTVIALEDDLDWHERVNRALTGYGIDNAIVRHAPLRRDLDGSVWYDAPAIGARKYGTVICDGPVRKYGRAGLWERCGEVIGSADWLVDDVDDPSQRAMLAKYATGRDVHVLGTDGLKKFAIARAPS